MSKRMKKFLGYYKPYRKIFFTDMFCALIASAITLIFPLLTRYIANDVLQAEGNVAFDIIWKIGTVMVVLVIIEYFANYYIAYKGHVMGAYMEADMRDELFQHYQKLSFNFYDDQKVGQLMTRLTNDLFSLTELYHHGPEDIVISFIKIIGAFVILIAIHVPLTLIVFGMIPFMIIFSVYYNKQMKRAFKANRKKIGDINARIEDSLSGIRVVKSFANEEQEMNRFQHENRLWIDTKRNSYHKMGRFHSGIGAFISMLSVVIILGAAYFISEGQMNAGDLIAYLLYISNLTDPIKRLINFTETFQDGISGFERFMELLEINPDIEDQPNAIELKDVKGNVVFEDVYFRYNEKSEYVLEDVNLDVNAGEYIALVGQSGAGKTTLCSLIPRFYEINKGDIKIDGISNRDIKLKSLRDNIGVVQQDVYLFAGTIMDNIAYGNLTASEEDIIRAAKQANAHEFIMGLEDGYYTDIGSRGVKLSGGQKQRLSIARVFLKNPAILIFDEATSALDNESEQVVQESLESLAKDRTTFVIAHRLSTIKNAKRIVVLGEHGIEETGNHEELLKQDGEYAKLYNMQFR
ncbi:ATP-binding cassette subfamily B protein [Breznakia sp. PF5-3]|uniref:ABC transporter ATP-binding protein n=1 Tax=unclassified Breznakia TaxID=2623764 RepID=UPI0024062012|nr:MULTISPECIES: ABC transporter ATP-binding protein [unclassified Breznakia]MDF9824264.1 ATP-binding cassette subfamily B protein [Breznakia sp. PM6-1]MDF9835488.1 ATP-binding cassette subfamily B protein [Breznakia sp. PF5-3]MDF9838038.1 ATP-binding cassette subfamily B protein [Breznakia sp. PFB2-8]MDF9859416.1 ATP-binding cassette subfamily B protein [Breznakia sp. PH5-24]